MEVIVLSGSCGKVESCVITKMKGRATANLKASLTLKCVVAVAFIACHLSAVCQAEVAEFPYQANSGGATEYQRNWPGDHPALYELNKSLILAIPPEYQKFWIQGGLVLRDPKQMDQAPDTKIVGFSFFLPDCSGYTPNNFRRDFDTSRVDVVSLEPANPSQADPDAPGSWPPNMIKRVLKTGIVGVPVDRYGLKCYHTRGGAGVARNLLRTERPGA